ncbi:MAG: DegQ family serine endoprotease [Deltaproteobacteria bacterium]|nr:DegQ family serine endoprotease [Deltaproteobacteria bacterium]NCP02255.1 DegQ family serine endoprotease [Deltaproteobacteria bacterium]NCP78511.1 DegQ family serine endoprotease [Desulfuromonadales bacterium]
MTWHKNNTRIIGLLTLLAVALLPAFASAADRGIESLRQTGQAFREVAKRVSPAVVYIQVEKKVEAAETLNPFNSPFGEEFFRRFFGQPPHGEMPGQKPQQRQPRRKSLGQGSGFLISPDGYIMTNNHVVGDADQVTVTLLDGREYRADIVGTDPPTDVAIIKIDESDLPFLRPADSDQLEVGDWVLAFGNPFGLSHTLTAGIVSAKGRSGIGLNDYENFIQTDAAINPGNSGGPLVDLDGKVVGMNTAIFSRSGGYMGIGFAIPINMAQKIREQLVENGSVTRGQLGVYIQDMNKTLAESFGLKEGKGILISQVIEGSPAQKGGLKQGDVVLEMGGQEVGKVADFRNRISFTSPGSKIKLLLLRNGKKETLTVEIGELKTDAKGQSAASGKLSKLGLSLQELTDDLAEKFGYQGQPGVLVTDVEPGSAAEKAGIGRGDLIQEVNRAAVKTPAEVRKAVEENQRSSLLLLVRQGDATRYLAIKLDN